ncbi:MAG: protein translocase subunit SecD [Candidatus Peribacteraceae bacterium]|nr:protein translocase subunit SecD [Candidatus Peribacteraceae bacterium]
MASRRTLLWPLVTAALGVSALLIALPADWKQLPPGLPQISWPGLHLGLDLAGGTQLDFRISEEEIRKQLADVDAEIDRLQKSGGQVEEINLAQAQRQSIVDQRSNLVEAIRAVLERRINSLGVSEATITPSYFGDERHLLVECPGLVDVQECIKVVGKTIQLEFKEPMLEATAEYKGEVRSRAENALRRITESGSTLTKEGQDLGSQLGMAYQPGKTFFRDQIPKGLDGLWAAAPSPKGAPFGGKVVLRDGSVKQPKQNADGSVTEQEVAGIFLAEVLRGPTATGRTIVEANKAFAYLAKTEPGASTVHHEKTPLDAKIDARVAAALRSVTPGSLKQVQTDAVGRILFLSNFQHGGEQISASHILVSYAGASGAGADVTRTKEQALARATQLLGQARSGANFTQLAATQSDGESRKDGGKLGSFGRGIMAPTFEEAAFALTKVGDLTEPVETQFGYHVIRLDKALSVTPDIATYDELVISGTDAQARTEALAAKLQQGAVKSTEPAVTLSLLFFSLEPTGWKDTALDGKHFRSATVSLDGVTNIPVVQIAFDAEGGKMFQELTKRNTGKQIAIFVGGELISAPRVNEEIAGGMAVITGNGNFDEARQLAQDLNTGAIPAPIHLVGQYTVEATLGKAALRTSLMAALIGTVILMLYMIVAYRILGLMADIALLFYAVLLFAIFKLPLLLFSSNYIVLTLAGMAGTILSIGMAVDANVLVFERMKEELRKGKLVKSAIESSFKHSWPAIRDGNITALITCLILFSAGTSIIRGFAVTLGMGTLLSMFTAVTVTRWLLRRLAETKLAERPELFGVKR